ncbi:MAG TPA: hypothetical protein VIK80_15530 [Flavihumibacter sp.]|jgi:uncharacterized membrane protein YgcG
MNLKFSSLIVGAAVLALSSCSSVYKSGQTPDDVYYSPGTTGAAYASSDDEGGQEYLSTNNRRRYNDRNLDPNYADDQYMRLAIASGRRPIFFDDFAMMNPYYRNNAYFNSWMVWNSPFYTPWNSMYMWNSFYNPYWGIGNGYYGGGFGWGWSPGWGTGWGHWAGGGYGYIGKPNFYVAPRPSRPASTYGMNSYMNTNSNRNGYRPNGSYYGNYNNRNNYNNNRAINNSNRNIFNNSRPSSNSSIDRPTRSYTPSSSSGSSNRGSSGGGGGVSRPVRTGN